MAKRISPNVKAKIAQEAIQSQKTVSEIASQYGVHPNFVTRVKTEALKKMVMLFDQNENKHLKEVEKERDELLSIIGEKERDISWLKKKCRQLGLL